MLIGKRDWAVVNQTDARLSVRISMNVDCCVCKYCLHTIFFGCRLLAGDGDVVNCHLLDCWKLSKQSHAFLMAFSDSSEVVNEWMNVWMALMHCWLLPLAITLLFIVVVFVAVVGIVACWRQQSINAFNYHQFII